MNPMFLAPGGRQPQMLGRVSPPAPPPTNMNTIYGPDPKAPPIMAYGQGNPTPVAPPVPGQAPGLAPQPQTQPPAPQPGAGQSPGRAALVRSVMAATGTPRAGGGMRPPPQMGRPMQGRPMMKPMGGSPTYKPPGG